MKLLIILLIIINSVAAWKFFSIPINKKSIATAIVLTTLPTLPICSAHADGALTGAMNAMMQESNVKDEEDNRSFNELPDGAKKRRAMVMCKDDRARKDAGYLNVAACNEAVLKGNYAIAFPTSSFKESKILQKVSESRASLPKSDSVPKTKKREKVQDFSDLSSAAKKRRASGACKKAEVRKYAGIPSEASCTRKVLNGEYDAVIEALEYGY